MWQVLLAAAVAGSTGLVAKHFFNPFLPGNPKRNDGMNQKQRDGTSNTLEEDKTPRGDPEPRTPEIHIGFLESGYESNGEIFRFSSTDSSGKSGSRSGSKISRRKSRIERRGLTKKDVSGGAAVERKSRGGLEVKRRRVTVCLKRQKPSKNGQSKAGSCFNRDNSVFGWGLGVGIMYMMSAGKAEINRLNAAMDETAKFVQELKEELHRRNLSRRNQVLAHACEVDTNSKKVVGKNSHLLGAPPCHSGEYASSDLTEEPELEIVEVDQLEAELQSELEKLPWCSAEISDPHGIEQNRTKLRDSASFSNKLADLSSESYQCNGVSPSVLDRKLCHLLIEQQENQIETLESKLTTAEFKLGQKEAELLALKECVKRLTEFSLSSTLSDDDGEAEPNQDDRFSTNAWIQQSSTDLERRKSLVGMKRPIDSQ